MHTYNIFCALVGGTCCLVSSAYDTPDPEQKQSHPTHSIRPTPLSLRYTSVPQPYKLCTATPPPKYSA